MAESEEKVKAEKLAAAKKRFEQLKKQKQGGKKNANTSKPAEANDEAEILASGEDVAVVDNDQSKQQQAVVENSANFESNEDGAEVQDTVTEADESLQRSQSFKKDGKSMMDPGPVKIDSSAHTHEDATGNNEAARIIELEEQLKSLSSVVSDLEKAQDTIETLRKAQQGADDWKAKAQLVDEQTTELENLKSELSGAQRQITQLQQAATSAKSRRVSNVSPPAALTDELASKTSTIESLELELSNLRNQVNVFETEKNSHDQLVRGHVERADNAERQIKTMEDQVKSLEERLNVSERTLPNPPISPKHDTTALQTEIDLLKETLRNTKIDADTANNRAQLLETKMETVTKLHRESSLQNAQREKEIKDLKTKVKSLSTSKSEAIGEDLSDLEDEEREKLHSRIRDLEAETFELRRGVWKDKRTTLQPKIDDGEPISPTEYEYSDVDLAGTPYGTSSSRPGMNRAGSGPRQTSTLSEVLQSGISAFTGRDNPRLAARKNSGGTNGNGHDRKRNISLGLLSEEGFDEDAFKQARVEEAAARLERVKAAKKGLEQWRNWRLDIVEMRRAIPMAMPIFEI